MKIAIVGTGVAGSYLLNQLGRNHKVTGFERYPKKKYQCVCAWGTTKDYISKYAEACDLNFDDYILHEGSNILVSFAGAEIESPLSGLVAFDKHRFLEDMQHGSKIKYGTWVQSENDLKGYDMVVDATGLRALLPKIQSHEILIPCVQYKVKYQDPPFDDFYIQVLENMGGYLWYFPLGGRWAHVGAGDLNHNHHQVIQDFFDRYGGEREKIVGRPVRLCPPKYCQPFTSGKVVGVGESIGTVFPLLGEGIIPTLQCAELLTTNLHDLDQYRREVLDHFAFYETAYNFLAPLLRGEVSLFEQAGLSLAVLLHMWANESRYGIKLQLSGMKVEPFSLMQQVMTIARMITI